MKITLVAAIASNNVIGYKNSLPWNIPSDLKKFKELTSGKTILIYTDGVTEGYVDEGKELEVEGLEKEIITLNTTSPETIINHATKILTEKGFTLRDDITALGIKL